MHFGPSSHYVCLFGRIRPISTLCSITGGSGSRQKIDGIDDRHWDDVVLGAEGTKEVGQLVPINCDAEIPNTYPARIDMSVATQSRMFPRHDSRKRLTGSRLCFHE
jgi:hypothetical protein